MCLNVRYSFTCCSLSPTSKEPNWEYLQLFQLLCRFLVIYLRNIQTCLMLTPFADIFCHDWINLENLCVYLGNNSTSKCPQWFQIDFALLNISRYDSFFFFLLSWGGEGDIIYIYIKNPRREDLGYCIIMQSLISLSNPLDCFLVYRWKITFFFVLGRHRLPQSDTRVVFFKST